MRTVDIGRVIGVSLLVLASGCTVLDVDMTTTPEVVKPGQPVTFNVKLTNRSSCPLDTSVAVIFPFIQAEHFLTELLGAPVSQAPELDGLLEIVREFFDELCAGGDPTLPTFSDVTTSCDLGSGAILCRLLMPLPEAHSGSSGSASLVASDNLQCELDDGTIRCQLRIPLPPAAATAGAVNNQLVQALNCVPIDEIDDLIIAGELGDAGALCFLGTLPDPDGLGPNEMATGQVSLPASGAGRVRNLVIAIADNEETLGVCKDGPNEGDACEIDSM